MITKTSKKLRSEGIGAVIRSIYKHILPQENLFSTDPTLASFFRFKTGLEIGGPSSIFESAGIIPIYSIANKIDNCNFNKNTVWEGEISEGNSFHFNEQKEPGCQFITEASDLSEFAFESYDFVLSSHCIEHLANPLQGLAEWMRVLKEEGVLVLALPHKDGTFDHKREATKIEHLLQDFDCHQDESDMTHLEEILEFHDLEKDPEAGSFNDFKERSKKNVENRCLHHHVFDTRLAIEMVHHAGIKILAVKLFQPFHIIILGRKIEQGEQLDNDCYRSIQSEPCWTSPFPSDQKNPLK